MNKSEELVHRNVSGQHIPMKEILKRVLELLGALEATLRNLQELNASRDPFINVVQSEIWQEKMKKFHDKIVLPILLYFDDFEPDNALGSHASQHKIAALYYSIACFPPECMSAVENMFLGLLFLSEDKVFKNQKVFKPIIDDLIDLETNGIEINGQRIYFCLSMILGDNLGMHELLGFTRGFNSNHPCRICKVHIDVLQSQIRADHTLIRNSENYSTDVTKNDSSKTAGITEKCVFNRIPSYTDPTKNPHSDIMHDICEGVGKLFIMLLKRKNILIF